MHYIGYLILALLGAFFVLLFFIITRVEIYKTKKHFEAEIEKAKSWIPSCLTSPQNNNHDL